MSDIPRIPPLPVAEFTDEQAELGGGRGSQRSELNFVRTLVRHPKLYGSWIPFAEQLVFGSTLPGRDREILIIRTSELCGERYEAAHHIHIGRTLGLTDAEMESAQQDGAILTPFEQALIRAVNELVADHAMSDATWQALTDRYSTEQMIDVVFVVANYSLMAMVTNSFGIKPEADVGGSWKPF
ncbi:carboxymuconolactone decarboxylase family protein [Novosphingobium sp. G106]|uniref:carboxymuconolactone decarboxylase family protein n=1 Tax=Novosphingobium sp. G106 TaxID=2849500 RepID=UPI001C2D5FD7|nr:carboxymuconolactone decarboxylase family protein [Novosphingobium sp. G106]MBV1687193.1 carboxymuconolactone decarboxylase family protein [Novosphingobium sp. G106]